MSRNPLVAVGDFRLPPVSALAIPAGTAPYAVLFFRQDLDRVRHDDTGRLIATGKWPDDDVADDGGVLTYR